RRVFGSAPGTPGPGATFLAAAASTTTPAPSQTVNFRLTGLTTGSTYNVAITALDTGGNESPCSGVASAVAQVEVTVAPTATVNFGGINIGSSATQTFTVPSIRTSTVTGPASVSAPFSILSRTSSPR